MSLINQPCVLINMTLSLHSLHPVHAELCPVLPVHPELGDNI